MSLPSDGSLAATSVAQGQLRQRFSVDLGPLRDAVDAHAKSQNLRVSDVVRAALQEHLDAHELDAAATTPGLGQPSAAYRPDLSAADAAKLDQLMAKTGRRTRLGVLRALINGIDLTQTAAPAAGGHNLGSAVQQLLASNHQLAGIGRNLNQIARSLNQYPGKTTPADRMLLEHAAVSVQSHLVKAAQLVGALRPLVRLPSEAPAKPRKAKPAPRKPKPGAPE